MKVQVSNCDSNISADEHGKNVHSTDSYMASHLLWRSGHRVAPASQLTVASRHRTRRRRWSNLVGRSRRPRSWPSRTPSTPGSSSTAAKAGRWTRTADITAPCRRSRLRLAYIASLSVARRTYTACSLTDTDSNTPLRTCTRRSVDSLIELIKIMYCQEPVAGKETLHCVSKSSHL